MPPSGYRFPMRRLCSRSVVGAIAIVAAVSFGGPTWACDHASSGSTPVQQVDLVALASIGFEHDVYTVPDPGKVRLTLSGASGMAITLTERPKVELVTPGPPSSTVLKLRRGTYHITSVIPGHTKAGVHALLVVG